ncbi:hypothetical protein [Halomontanus rarus]|uniref:hypothetical protein n=1 Tax=Halomontanus rarus TaxID=3034020 RepID=UPI0023E76E55|nr:hypothetical protein [Halovivax sp. TS33]
MEGPSSRGQKERPVGQTTVSDRFALAAPIFDHWYVDDGDRTAEHTVASTRVTCQLDCRDHWVFLDALC